MRAKAAEMQKSELQCDVGDRIGDNRMIDKPKQGKDLVDGDKHNSLLNHKIAGFQIMKLTHRDSNDSLRITQTNSTEATGIRIDICRCADGRRRNKAG